MSDRDEYPAWMTGPYVDVTALPVDVPTTRDADRLRETPLFNDYDDDDETWRHLTALWQAGLLAAEWDAESERTAMNLTELGLYLVENQLAGPYLQQFHLTSDDERPPAIRALQEMRD